MDSMESSESKSRLKINSKFVLMAFLAIGAVYLIKEYASQALAALPYLLILLCPVMHLFMHRGGHGGGHDGSHGKPPAQGSDKE